MHYPEHIGIIPDGNRTWATQHNKKPIEGHLAGQENAVKLMRYIFKHTPINVATFWALSTENALNRTQQELDYLYEIYEYALDEVEDMLTTMGISLRWIGTARGLPEKVVNLLKERVKKHTYDGVKTLVLAVNYGGRNEIVRAVRKVVTQADKNTDTKNIAESIDQKTLSEAMELGDLPTIDFIIRTKGQFAKRLSGFMLWWMEYAELFFTDILFPDFDDKQLQYALEWYDSIADKRNFGE